MKKTLIFGLVCILVTLILVSYNLKLQKKLILKESQTTMISLISSVEMDLERTFYGLDQVFLGLDNYLNVCLLQGSTDSPAVSRVINDLLQQNSYLTALVVLDGSGQVLHWNNNFQKPNLSQRDYFRIHKTQHSKGLYIGQPQESILNKGQWILGISRAFRDRNGNLTGVIAAIVDVKSFYRQYEELFTRADTQLTISSLQGHIYTRIPGHDSYAGQIDPDINKQLQLADITPDVQYHQASNGEMYLTAVRKVGEYPLLVSVAKMEKDALVAWQQNIRSFTLLGVLLSLALLFFTHRTVRHQQGQIKITEQLQLLVISDPLTKLVNRSYVLDQAQIETKKARRSSAPLSMIIVDLDHFKEINDNYGQQVGDNVLKTAGGLLKQTCRESDIISRFSGEEFLLILPDTALDGAIILAGKIREALEKNSYQHRLGEFQVTASLGVTQWGEDEEGISGALQRVESALYQAQKAGRNTVEWIPSNLRSEGTLDSSLWFERRQKERDPKM